MGRIPLPKTALLKRQPPPSCEYRTASLDDTSKRGQQDGGPPAEANPDLALRTKLDYERQCYRHAEMIARSRLKSLQESVQDTVKAVKRSETGQAQAQSQ